MDELMAAEEATVITAFGMGWPFWFLFCDSAAKNGLFVASKELKLSSACTPTESKGPAGDCWISIAPPSLLEGVAAFGVALLPEALPVVGRTLRNFPHSRIPFMRPMAYGTDSWWRNSTNP